MLKIISSDQLLQRINIYSNGNIWSALVINDPEIKSIAEELKDLIEIFAECEIELISAKEGVQKILEMIIKSSADYLILFNFENWSYENWIKLEAYRSCLDRKKKEGFWS